MKRNNLGFIIIALALTAPIISLLVFPGMTTSIRRISALSGEVLFYSMLGSLGLTLVYLIYRLIYVSQTHRSYIEFSATTLLIHLLSQTVWILALVGGLTTYKLIGYSSFGTWIGLVMILTTIHHITLDISLYSSRENATLYKAFEASSAQHIPSLLPVPVTGVFIVLLMGVIVPTALQAAILVGVILVWEVVYLLVARPVLAKNIA
jgi:hypothetical protein